MVRILSTSAPQLAGRSRCKHYPATIRLCHNACLSLADPIFLSSWRNMCYVPPTARTGRRSTVPWGSSRPHRSVTRVRLDLSFLLSLPNRAISEELACVAWPPREVWEQGQLFTLPDAPSTGYHLIRGEPWQQGLHWMHLAVEGRIHLQYGD
jgi:hypothetical protein